MILRRASDVQRGDRIRRGSVIEIVSERLLNPTEGRLEVRLYSATSGKSVVLSYDDLVDVVEDWE